MPLYWCKKITSNHSSGHWAITANDAKLRVSFAETFMFVLSEEGCKIYFKCCVAKCSFLNIYIFPGCFCFKVEFLSRTAVVRRG